MKAENENLNEILCTTDEDRKIKQYLNERLGPEPVVAGSRRRWDFLQRCAFYIYSEKEVSFVYIVKWFAKNGECLKVRTILEDYIQYLNTLGIVEFNVGTKTVRWKQQ